MYKKILCFLSLFLLLIMMFNLNTKASFLDGGITKTGHNDIVEISFKNRYSNNQLLNQISSSTLDNYYKRIKRSAFGWSAVTINEDVPVKYVSEVILSKSNQTRERVVYKYNLTYSTSTTLERSLAGSVALKLSGKIKGITAGVEANLKASITQTIKKLYEEKMSFDVSINPYRKVSLIIRGDGELSNGVAKQYFFGIQIKKGTWEYLNRLTEYYEMYEEVL